MAPPRLASLPFSPPLSLFSFRSDSRTSGVGSREPFSSILHGGRIVLSLVPRLLFSFLFFPFSSPRATSDPKCQLLEMAHAVGMRVDCLRGFSFSFSLFEKEVREGRKEGKDKRGCRRCPCPFCSFMWRRVDPLPSPLLLFFPFLRSRRDASLASKPMPSSFLFFFFLYDQTVSSQDCRRDR